MFWVKYISVTVLISAKILLLTLLACASAVVSPRIYRIYRHAGFNSTLYLMGKSASNLCQWCCKYKTEREKVRAKVHEAGQELSLKSLLITGQDFRETRRGLIGYIM